MTTVRRTMTHSLKAAFAHVTTWVFDLDNTLYPPEMALFDQINAKMTTYVMGELRLSEAEADRLRHRYWQDHGTTLAGLMEKHGIDPAPYLKAVHDIDFSVLSPDPTLAAQIKSLPGRKIIYTNGTASYADQVIAHRGLAGCFDAVYGVEEAGLHPKPDARAFETVFALDGFDRQRAAMFEDEPRNLKVPHGMGLQTVHIATEATPAPFIDHHSAALDRFLAHLL